MTQSGDQVEVVALVFIDPGGHVPKWLVNWFAGRMARSTLHDLRKQVAKHLYPPAQVHEMERRSDLLAEVGRVSLGDPLTIRLLVEALQDGTLSPGRLTSLPPGLESFVRNWLNELEQHSAQQKE